MAQWYFIVASHDPAANTISVQVDNGATDSVGWAFGILDGASFFGIGSTSALTLMDGRIGPTMFWKSAAGAGGVLTATQRTALYAAGAGLTYAAFTS